MIEISIIMGLYNCQSTLSEAIDSILNQTKQDWQLILCDDGSKDYTFDVAKQYADRYSEKIVLLKNESNMGLNSTLNRCLKEAKGKYIARMDGDDISLPTRLEEEATFLDQFPEYAIVSCPMFYFDENGDWGRGIGKGEVKVSDFIKGTPFCHAPCMVRKEAYETVGGYSNDHRTLRVEDYDLWFRMYEKGYKGYNLSEPLYKMRDDQNAYHRRKFKFALNEAYVRFTGYRRLKLPISVYFYALRPILVGLIPKPIYMYFHHKKKVAI